MLYAKNKAKEFATKYNINYSTLSIERLKLIAHDLHAKILSYEQLDDNIEIEEIIDSCTTEGVTYAGKNGDSYLILYSGTISSQKAIYIIIHELAHIFLNHIAVGSIGYVKYDSPQEREANVFACCVLAPTKNLLRNFIFSKEKLIDKTYIPEEQADIALEQVLNIKSKLKNGVKSFLIISLLSFALYYMCKFIDYNKQNDFYYVTQYGEKYHLQECRYLVGKDTKKLDPSELKFYEPCKVCIDN